MTKPESDMMASTLYLVQNSGNILGSNQKNQLEEEYSPEVLGETRYLSPEKESKEK